ncbi:MAG: cupredoxin domain-containing protein [Solirubrobacterales bacterium]
MATTIFYILGSLLVVSALVVAAHGLRREETFPSGLALGGVVAYFTALVLGTMTLAVLNANAEKDKRKENEESAAKLRQVDQTAGVAQAEAPSNEGASGQTAPPPSTGQQAPPAGPAQTLKITSPATGALEYTPASLSAEAGTVTIDYDNPSPVAHSVAIEDSNGETLNASDVGADGTFTASADLSAGTYAYYCTVPGHRESGMEGTLTVK